MSRFDAVGLWWQDFPQESIRGQRVEHVRNIEPPDTNWSAPKDFPNLQGIDILGIDTETKDLNLEDRGPGGVRGDGHIIGVSIATPEQSWYFPMRHEYGPQAHLNMEPSNVLHWLSDTIQARPTRSYVGANLLYDLEWLKCEGVEVPLEAKLFDIQYAEPLLDEEARSYALESLARKHLGEGKETPLLYKWCADSFGGESTFKQAKNFWRSPPSLVGPYAEADAMLPLRILAKQRLALANDGLLDLFALECRLIPLLLAIRYRGVRVNTVRAEEMVVELSHKATLAQQKIPGIDVWSNESIAKAFNAVNEEYLLTAAGNPSFTKLWLENCPHPLAADILDVRLYEKAVNPFIQSYILDGHHEGRLHCQFHPLRSDIFGTVSGRFSSSNPNLQNIPARHPVIAPMIRSLFIPEQGCRWKRADYSQIEYRLLTHDMIGVTEHARKVADAMRARFNNDPSTDYHKMTQLLVKEITGIELERRPSKNLNFGLVYGMGKEKLIRSLGVSTEIGNRLYEAYFDALPCVKDTLQSAQRLASRRGYIKTLLGRRRRFNRMEEGKYGGEQRQGTHAALNARLQGGAADIMKKAMVDCFEAGLFAEDACGIPHLTVHDELDWSDTGSKWADDAFTEAKHVMENCVKLKIPLMVDIDEGENWGACL